MKEQLGPGPTSAGRVLPDRLLETHPARVLFDAQRQRRTGTLTLDEGAVSTRLRLVDGAVVFAEAGTLAETLGRVLVRNGTLDRDEYLLILERMAEPSERDELLRFGEVAIQLGMLSAAELGEALALQVRVKLQHCLLVDEAVWSWQDGDPPNPGASFPTPLESTLRAALREDPQRYRWPGLLSVHRRRLVRLYGEPDEIARRFEVSPPELRLLRHIDDRPLETVLSSGILEPDETGAWVAALMFAGVLQLGPHVSDRVGASSAQTVVGRARPRRPGDAGAPPPRPTATSSDSAAASDGESTTASETGRAHDAADRLRAEMERRGRAASSQRTRLDAERAFEKGRALLANGNVHGARGLLERATQLMPEAAEYALHLRWCEYLDEQDPVRRPVYEQLLRAAVLDALTQDRKMAFAHYVQGRLYLLDDDRAAAERALRIASKLDPNDLEVARHLRLLERRRGR